MINRNLCNKILEAVNFVFDERELCFLSQYSRLDHILSHFF